MTITFPVFVLALDDRSILKHDAARLLDYYEEPDIEEGIYKGWDCNGLPFEVLWDAQAKEPYIKPVECGESQISELREALLNYAKAYSPELQIPVNATDPMEIFSLIEGALAEHRRLHGVKGRLKRLGNFLVGRGSKDSKSGG